MIRCIYIIKRDGDPLHGRSFEDDTCLNLDALPSYVRNAVVMMQSSSSTSSDRVYTLEFDGSLWAYSFFHSFALISLASKDQSMSQLKNIMSSLGRAIAHQFGDLVESWSGTMSDIVDVNSLIDNYVALDLDRPSKKVLKVIDGLVSKALKQPEIAFVGIFDSEGDMISGTVPDLYLFRIQVEISQGVIKPVMDIVPSTIKAGDHTLQMFNVNSLTVVVASQPGESNLHAISTVGEIAHALNEKLS
ncbi:MAG: hypothetical protein AM325_002020 [Candidatus Thorarchaeota archaeon SMTZ1-45]|nr:MAG: hypothetical protein AM325_03825 [Candidatus Thorarchaeota archaeon SMTZ1-45]